jgi:hypothetical protein
LWNRLGWIRISIKDTGHQSINENNKGEKNMKKIAVIMMSLGVSWPLRSVQKMILAFVVITVTVGSASAVPPTPNTSGLTPEQCYRKDSDCTQFCDKVTGELRYECFGICDRMLDHCLDTGDWTDSYQVDPGTGRPPTKGALLSSFFMRLLMTLGDTDGDGELSPKEFESFKKRVFRGPDTKGKQQTSPTPDQR